MIVLRNRTPCSPVSRPGRGPGHPANAGWMPAVVVIVAVVAGIAGSLTACGGAAGTPVALDDTWPSTPGQYDDVSRAWTRHAVMQQFDQQVLEVYATFKSPAWRAAHLAHSTETRSLAPDARTQLEQMHRTSSIEFHEVQLLVTTWDRAENDLQKGASSVWTLALRDDKGGVVEPVSITRDKRPIEVIRAEYPDMGDFATAYVVRFPRTLQVLRQDARQLSMTMASARGTVELVWHSR